MLQQLRLHRRNLYWVGGVSALIALLAVWTFAIEWEWTMNGDDAGFVQSSRTALVEGGIWGLINTAFASAVAEPASNGRFRPVYLLYSQFAYLLSPDLMRGLRMISVLLVLWSLLRLIPKGLGQPAKNWALIWVVSLFASNYTLFFGLQFASFQELTGVTLIAIGLLNRNLYWQSTWFALAALMKEPFIPLMFLFAIYLFHKGKRAAGATLLIIGVSMTLPILLFSGSGSYTEGAFAFNPWHLWSNVQSLMSTGALTVVIAILGLVLLKNVLRFDWRSWTFIGAAASYAGVLLFWWAGGYYTSPVWYLLTVGLTMALAPPVPPLVPTGLDGTSDAQLDAPSPAAKILTSTVLGAGLMASVLLMAETFRNDILGWNTTYVEARDWVLNDLPAGATYYLYDMNPTEFDFYLREKDPSWDRAPSLYWQHNSDPPSVIDSADFVIASTTVTPHPETAKCPAIRVWTKGFIAPTKC